jgi:hypothetical protein
MLVALLGYVSGDYVRLCLRWWATGLLGEGLSGHLEHHSSADLDRVVGKAFVEPAQQGDVDGGGDAVFPLSGPSRR